ncbi:MAG: hypothetical protein U0Q16_02155 [Bryobacteraceae bacterium]
MPFVFAAVFLTSLSLLVLELALTRLFSVVFYYHFAFLAISIALFGLGAGGVLSYFIRSKPPWSKLGWISAANSALVLLALQAVLRPDPDLTNARLAFVYVAASVPFIAGGAILSSAISETIAHVDRVYFFDLAGAAAGCLVLIPLLNNTGGPGAILGAAAGFAAAAGLWFLAASQTRLAGAAAVLALAWCAFLPYNRLNHVVDVTFAKGTALTDEIFVRWNSISRIAVRQEKGWGGPAIFIDADANTGIASENPTEWSEDRRQLFIRNQGSSLPYVIRPGAKTLIIGPGGGWDVTHSLASGSKDITAVEINPIIANDVMRGKFAHVSHGLYSRPELRVIVEDGRAFVRRSPEKYQVIQATLVDTWAATAAGAFALSESNLYTVEAFADYLGHLSDDGLLSLTRWGFEPPRESLRLVSLAIEALKRLGETEPAKHVLIIREGTRQQLAGIGAQDTVVIARKPYRAEDLARVRALLAEGKFQPVYLPDQPLPNQFAALLTAPDPTAYQRAYAFDISPAYDDRPFFFYSVQPRDLWKFLYRDPQDPVDYKINKAVPVLFGLVGVSLLATLLVLALPPLLLGTRLPRKAGVAGFLPYFAAIGTGYILIEVALIQRFVLFLGHPVYALTVVIFGMLVASGVGSYLSRRVRVTPVAVTGLVFLLSLALAPFLAAAVGWPLPLKIALTVAIVAPVAFLMGLPFPTGLRILESWHPPAVRWAWSLNAASSVLGSALAMFLSIYFGLTKTLWIGGLAYALAALLSRAAKSSDATRTSNVGRAFASAGFESRP